MFLLSKGNDSPGCGFTPLKPCKTFQALLDSYKTRTKRTWLYNTVITTDESFVIDGSDFKWNGGVGQPDQQTCFNVTNLQKSTLSVVFANLVLSHVTMELRHLNVDFNNCTFVGTKIEVLNSFFANISSSEFTNLTRMDSIHLNDIEEIHISDCKITNNIVNIIDGHYTSTNKSRNLMSMENAKVASMQSSTFLQNENAVSLHVNNIGNFHVASCAFNQNNYTTKISFAAMIVKESTVQIEGTNFTSNIGGALLTETSRITMRNLQFHSNINKFHTILEVSFPQSCCLTVMLKCMVVSLIITLGQ